MATKEKKHTPPPAKKPVPYEPSELVIKEMMVQKNCTRDKAIEILKNPAQ